MQPQLTAIIVNHDTRAQLLACLESIPAASVGLSVQVIVVDNASNDGSLDAVRRRYPAVQTLSSQTNEGFSRACNRALRHARAPFVAFLNPDLVCAPECLSQLVAYLREHPNVGAVGPRLTHPDGNLQPSAYRVPSLAVECASVIGLRRVLPVAWLRRSRLARRVLPDTGHFNPHDQARSVDFVTGACIVARRDAVARVGGFDEAFFMYYEEIDLCQRLREAGWRVFHVPEASAMHYLNGSGRQRPGLTYLAREQSRLRFHGKVHSRPSVAVLRAVLMLAQVAAITRARWLRMPDHGEDLNAAHHVAVMRWCWRPGRLPEGPPLDVESAVRPVPVALRIQKRRRVARV